jgi:diguanylate cyclase (GGDEF)-like protein
MGKHKNQLLAMVRDWGNRPFNKAEFGAFVKAQLPGLSEDFVNHFANVAEDWHLRKASLLKSDEQAQESFEAPIKKEPKKTYFDENTGILHTDFGSFQAQAIPYQQGPEDARAFNELLEHPNLQKVMDTAIPNWYKANQLAGKRELPEEIPLHAAIFSIMSANNQAPVNELQFSKMIDAMKKTGLDPRKPGFEAILPEMKTLGRPTRLSNSLAEYNKVHQKVLDAFKKHGNSMIDLGGALKDLVPGLGVKTALFAAGSAGGGSSPVPDTHHIRSKFGLHVDKDAATIKKIEEQMWAPENYDTVMRPYAKWFAKNSLAVKHMLSNPKFAHMFKGHEEDAAFPGFWLDWQTIAPWEKSKGLPSKSKTGEATHKPVWDAFNKFVKSEKFKQEDIDPTLPMRTALVHQKYLENYGEVPASLLYYTYIVPKLLEAAEARKKTESGLDFLTKSDVLLAKSREIESKLIELRKTVREAVEGAQVEMPEVHRVDIKSGDKTHPAGRYMIHDNKLSHLEDYHGILSSVLPEGPIDANAIAHLHGLKLSPNFVVRQHEPKENEEPKEVREALPQVQVSEALPQPQRAPVFDYYRPGLAKPHSVEFGPNGAALDGQKLSHQELGLMLENARSGLATIKYRKAEVPLKKAEMEPSEALKNVRELTSKGLLHPSVERALTRHIYGDPMVEGVGNKYAFNEFRKQNRPGVWASIDANNFKKINDSFGHETGDQAIKALGGALRDAGAKVGTGKIMRNGGDEFAAWFPSYEEASRFIGHAKKHVDALPPVAGIHKHSFSFGLGSDYTGADTALRKAKEQKVDPISGQLKHAPGNTPHFGHSLVPGTEGAMPPEAEGPSQKVLPKSIPQPSASL